MAKNTVLYDKKSRRRREQPILIIILSLLAVICLLPLFLVIIVSFSAQSSIDAKGFSFFPTEWSLAGWEYVLGYRKQIIQSYLITIYETVCGTALMIILTSMFSYALSRKDWVLHRFWSIFLLITMLFHGGIVSEYIINVSLYDMKDNLLILILPGAVTAYNCFVMRTFINSNVPDSLIEAAKIDGAGEFLLFFKIVLPIMVPACAALGFMCAVGHWNEWQTSLLYISDADKSTLQLMLIRIEKDLQFLLNNADILGAEEMSRLADAPTEPMRMAILLVTLGPILIAYPFFQKYFIQGITVGSVKG